MSESGLMPLKLNEFMEAQEKMYLELLLKENNWKMQITANAAGISRKSLWQKLKKYGIARPADVPVLAG